MSVGRGTEVAGARLQIGVGRVLQKEVQDGRCGEDDPTDNCGR